MNNGISLSNLAAELERQATSRKDFLASQGAIKAIVADNNEVAIDGLPNEAPVALTNYAHGQLSDHLGIPKKYYDRMATEQPDLLAVNINRWFSADSGNRRMLRVLDGKVRGILSPKFRALDNFDLAQAVLPVLLQNKAEIVSSQLTETRMYIKAILPGLSDSLPEGLAFGTGHNAVGGGYRDRGKVVAAIVISNSDIGAGTLRVEPSVFTTWCTNLAIMQQAAMKKYHAGRANQADESWQVFADETRKADDAAFWMKVRDITSAAFDEKQFRMAVETLRVAGNNPITSDALPAVVEMAVEQLALPPSSSNGILKLLAQGGDLSQLGLSQAITRFSGQTEDYEMATLMERAGGTVIDLKPTDWKRIAEAA